MTPNKTKQTIQQTQQASKEASKQANKQSNKQTSNHHLRVAFALFPCKDWRCRIGTRNQHKTVQKGAFLRLVGAGVG